MSTKHAVDFRAIKQAVSIAQILDHYGLTETFTRSQNGDSLSGPCPLHGGQNQSQFRVSLSKNCWNCFGDCKSGGNILDFVCRKEDCTLREAAILIRGWFNIPSNSAESKRDAPSNNADSPSPARVQRATNDDAPNKPLGFELQRLDTAHPYLAERGLEPDTITHFGLGYCSNGSMSGRIVIPIFNPQAEEGSNDRAVATRQERTTDDDGRDRIELKARTVDRVAGRGVDDEHDTAESGAEARERIDSDFRPEHRQTHEERARLTSTDRIDGPPEPRVLCHERRDQENNEERDRRKGQPKLVSERNPLLVQPGQERMLGLDRVRTDPKCRTST